MTLSYEKANLFLPLFQSTKETHPYMRWLIRKFPRLHQVSRALWFSIISLKKGSLQLRLLFKRANFKFAAFLEKNILCGPVNNGTSRNPPETSRNPVRAFPADFWWVFGFFINRKKMCTVQYISKICSLLSTELPTYKVIDSFVRHIEMCSQTRLKPRFILKVLICISEVSLILKENIGQYLIKSIDFLSYGTIQTRLKVKCAVVAAAM